VIFSYPLNLTPQVGGPRWNIAIAFGMEKLEWRGYLTVEKSDGVITHFDTIHDHDRQTRWMDRHHMTSLSSNNNSCNNSNYNKTLL